MGDITEINSFQANWVKATKYKSSNCLVLNFLFSVEYNLHPHRPHSCASLPWFTMSSRKVTKWWVPALKKSLWATNLIIKHLVLPYSTGLLASILLASSKQGTERTPGEMQHSEQGKRDMTWGSSRKQWGHITGGEKGGMWWVKLNISGLF